RSRNTRQRNPSHFGSNCQSSPVGISSTERASIGGMGGFSIILYFSSQAKQSWTLFKEPFRSLVGLALRASRGVQRTVRPTNLIGRSLHTRGLFSQINHSTTNEFCCLAKGAQHVIFRQLFWSA